MDAIAEEEEAQEEGVPVPWSGGELPDEVIAKIQARLPLVSLVRSRAVCREWNAAVESSGLLQERLESGAGARDWMLFVAGSVPSSRFEEWMKEDASCAYHPAPDRWYKVPLPLWFRRCLPNRETPIMGGVLVTNLQHKGSIQIGNPVARSWALLPAFPDSRLGPWDVRGLLVDAVARSFKLVVVRETTARDPTFVFDSALGSWSVTTKVPAFLPLSVFMRGQGVFVGTVLYCLPSESTTASKLLTYDLEQGRWSRLAVATPVDCTHISFSNPINMRERLLCAGIVCVWPSFVKKHGAWKSLQIWEMDFERMAWRVVNFMPAPMFTDWRKGLGEFYPCEPLLQAVAGQDEVYIMDETQDAIAALDLRDTPGAWRLLPTFPYKGFEQQSFHSVHPWLQFGSWFQG